MYKRQPTYSRGVSELRKGINTIVLLTDGILEFENSPYIDSQKLYKTCYQKQSLSEVLQNIHKGQGRDSGTIISFNVDVGNYTGAIPSNQ